MKTSNKGIELIKRFEGLRLKAYQDSRGTWTIGYGHTGGVKSGDVITEQEEEKLLENDLKTAENAVNEQNLSLSQNQFDALVSFVYNVGTRNFRTSTLLKKAKLNANDPTIRYEFSRWNKVRRNGVYIPIAGLTRRRAAEADLYFTK
jgi:lysozyme